MAPQAGGLRSRLRAPAWQRVLGLAGCCSGGWSRSWPSRSRPQQRLDRIAELIAANLVAEVCSVYFNRAGEVLELFATIGLAPEAVHRTRMRVGEGLVGTIAAQGKVINTADAQSHPNFRYFPRDARGDLPLVPGRADPARRARRRRAHGPEPGASRLCRGRDRGDADHRLDPGRDVRLGRADRPEQVRRHRAPTPPPCAGSTGPGWSRGWRSARPGCTSRGSRSPGCWPRIPQVELRAAGAGHRRAARHARPDAGDQRPGRRRAARGARGLPHVRPRHRLAAAHPRGDRHRPLGRGGGAAGAGGDAGPDRARQRSLPARAADRSRRHRQPAAAPLWSARRSATTRPGCPRTPSWWPAISVPPTCSSTTVASCAGSMLEEGSQDRARHDRRPRDRHPDGRPDRGGDGCDRSRQSRGARRRQRARLSSARTTRSCRPSSTRSARGSSGAATSTRSASCPRSPGTACRSRFRSTPPS